MDKVLPAPIDDAVAETVALLAHARGNTKKATLERTIHDLSERA